MPITAVHPLLVEDAKKQLHDYQLLADDGVTLIDAYVADASCMSPLLVLIANGYRPDASKLYWRIVGPDFAV